MGLYGSPLYNAEEYNGADYPGVAGITTEPRIYTKNYFSRDSQWIISHGASAAAYLYDRDNLSKWQSVGAASDSTDVTIQCIFYEGIVPVYRTIDRFFMINHNVKSWKLEYFNETVWATLDENTGETSSNTLRQFSAVTTMGLRLTLHSTQTADAEKFIGELFACALKLEIGLDLTDNDPSPRSKDKEIVLGDGSIHYSVTRFAPNRTQKYGAKVSIEYVSDTLRTSLEAIKNEGTPFLWQPESVARPADIFFVHWVGGFAPKYMSGYKGAGFRVTLDLKEV